MSKATLILFLTSLMWFSEAHGQDEDTQLEQRVYSSDYRKNPDSAKQKRPMGKITVVEDARITKLDSLRKEYPGQQDGYRVQIFFGKRQEALERKAEFAETHPDLPAYISYLAPNFRLRIGDFRTRMEGEKLKQEIDNDFPGSYLVKDKIEMPSLDKTQKLTEEDSDNRK